MTAFSNAEKADCAMREAAIRRSFYAKRIAARRMDPSFAERELALMREIAADYAFRANEDDAKAAPVGCGAGGYVRSDGKWYVADHLMRAVGQGYGTREEVLAALRKAAPVDTAMEEGTRMERAFGDGNDLGG